MAGFTRVNGLGHALGTLYDTLQVRAFKITPTTALTAGIGGTAEALMQEFGTTGALAQVKSDGTSMILIGDAHALSADTIDVRATQILGESVTVAALTSFYSIS
jgi:hypothetical protein